MDVGDGPSGAPPLPQVARIRSAVPLVPLFPRTRRWRGNVMISDGYACSPQRMSEDIKFAMSQMGANPDRFSGVSARKGGLSTAIEAGIHEAVLFLQTGHGQAKAARDYMHIRDPSVLIQVFGAFKL